MTGTALVPQPVETEIAALARRYRSAGGMGMAVLNVLGGQAENLLERLPDRIKARLEGVTERALETSMSVAAGSRGVVRDQKSWFNTALTTAMGAAGGAGGLPSALAEIPVTTTVLLRSIQGIAAEHGFDPDEPEIRRECLAVFGSAGPMAKDDGADMAFLSARVTLTGATLHGVIAKVAPRFATVLGQKLAAQAVPILGAAAGAATNYAYTSYYQEMARVHFGVMKLARDSGQDREALIAALGAEIKRQR